MQGLPHARFFLPYFFQVVVVDACCYNRPFDDQDDDKIRLESEAVKTLINKAMTGEMIIVSSDVIDYEINNITDLDRKDAVLLLYTTTSEIQELNESIISRAREIEKIGIDTLDALHIASAEKGKVDIFFTVDDAIVKRYNDRKAFFKLIITNPLRWMAGQTTT